MQILTLTGSPRQMGNQFGEECREAIQAFYSLRLEIAIEQAKVYGGRIVHEEDVLNLAQRCLEITRQYDPKGTDELEGIAEAARLSGPQLLALNGLTDLRDALAWAGDLEAFGGCSSFIAQSDTTGPEPMGVLCGQTWDLATSNMPYVLGVHRKPANAPESWTLTTVGCLSLIGMNEAGVAIGTTNLRTVDAKPGVVYLSIIHRVLGCRDHQAAVEAVVNAPRAGAHFYYIATADGRASAIECTATRTRIEEVTSGIHVHCNHCLVEEHVPDQGAEPTPSSRYRTQRLRTLLESGCGHNNLDTARQYLSDTQGGDDAICRDDFGGISSNGAVLMAPEQGEIIACHGLPSTARWVSLKER